MATSRIFFGNSPTGGGTAYQIDAPVATANATGLLAGIVAAFLISVPLGTVVAAGPLPGVSLGNVMQAPVGQVVASAPQPLIGLGLFPPVGTVAAGGLTPVVSATTTVSAPTGQATLAGLNAGCLAEHNVDAPAGTVSISAPVPTVTKLFVVPCGAVSVQGLGVTLTIFEINGWMTTVTTPLNSFTTTTPPSFQRTDDGE